MRERSPNYPAISLEEAVDLARKLYKNEKRTSVSQEVAVKAWGYKSLSGPARTKLSALRKYGLLSGSGGTVQLTELAIRILEHKPTEKEHKKALQKAIFNVDLFRELQETHRDASDDAIRTYLITKKGFSPKGAEQLTKSYRNTIKLVTPEALPSDELDYAGGAENIEEETNLQSQKSSSLKLQVPFRDTQLSVIVQVTGQRLTKEHIARVRSYLELAEDDLDSATNDKSN